MRGERGRLVLYYRSIHSVRQDLESEKYWSNLDAQCIAGPVEPRYRTPTRTAASHQFGLSQTACSPRQERRPQRALGGRRRSLDRMADWAGWRVSAGWVAGSLAAVWTEPDRPLYRGQAWHPERDVGGGGGVLVRARGYRSGGRLPGRSARGCIQQIGLTQTDVFAVDKNGTLHVMWESAPAPGHPCPSVPPAHSRRRSGGGCLTPVRAESDRCVRCG